MVDKHLQESDFKIIIHSKDIEIEKISFEDFQIYKKTEESIIADIAYLRNNSKEDDYDFKDYVSEFYINIKTNCKIKSSNERKTVVFPVDVNSLNLRAVTKFCVEAKNLDIINYISNKNFYYEKENHNLTEVSSEYDANPIIQNTIKSIFTKIAAKQTIEKFKFRTKFSCPEDNSLEKACKTMPLATDFKLDNKNKQFCFEKTFYENDKRCKTTYVLYSKNSHIIYEVNNYTLENSYTFNGGFVVDTKSSEIILKTTEVIDNEKIVVERDYENRKLLFTFIGGENSKLPE